MSILQCAKVGLKEEKMKKAIAIILVTCLLSVGTMAFADIRPNTRAAGRTWYAFDANNPSSPARYALNVSTSLDSGSTSQLTNVNVTMYNITGHVSQQWTHKYVGGNINDYVMTTALNDAVALNVNNTAIASGIYNCNIYPYSNNSARDCVVDVIHVDGAYGSFVIHLKLHNLDLDGNIGNNSNVVWCEESKIHVYNGGLWT